MTVFLCSSSRRLFTRATPIPLFNTESETLVGVCRFSTLSPDAPASSPFHSSSEDLRNVGVSVWWNLENCPVPNDANGYKVSRFIMAAVRANGIKGSIEIKAFGNTRRLSLDVFNEMYSTGITFKEGITDVDKLIVEQLMNWVSDNPPPAHIFLISSNGHFARILHGLRTNNYNILLAITDNAPAILCSAASIMWQWTALIKGENLSGKHFNQPPGGPFAKWYGHYRVPLEDPFVIFNQSSCLQSEEVSGSSTSTKDPVPVTASKENSGHNTSVPLREETLSSPFKLNLPKLSTDSKAPPGKLEEQQNVQEQPPLIRKAKEGEMSLSQLDQLKMERSIPEIGILKTIWRKWFSGIDSYQEKISCTASQDSMETANANMNCPQSNCQSPDLGKLFPSSLSTNEVIPDAEIGRKCAENVDNIGKPRGFFNQILRWCKFWRSDKNFDNLNAEEFGRSDKELSSCSEMRAIFTESFWNDKLVILETPGVQSQFCSPRPGRSWCKIYCNWDLLDSNL